MSDKKEFNKKYEKTIENLHVNGIKNPVDIMTDFKKKRSIQMI